jgi:demethylmenaquinone methyltransferase / 2-methoxy-6-polyprenyl-1,4-benzoquinol methylase
MHAGEEKKVQVQKMFDGIAHRYDFMNHFLSLGIDKRWREKAIDYVNPKDGELILDVASGTGDQGFSALEKANVRVVGCDYSINMLKVGKRKIIEKHKENDFLMIQGDAENLPVTAESFDAVMISYGIRNVGNIKQSLQEFYKALKPGGRVVILEFSEPTAPLFASLYQFYFNMVLPRLAGLFSNKSAYTYLPESVKHFPSRHEIKGIMEIVGFENNVHKDLTFGITSIFYGEKPLST